MSKKFTIDTDMLGIVAFLVRGGNGSSIFSSGDVWFLREIAEELKPEHWMSHIVALAFDNISMAHAELLVYYAKGKCSLTKETERYFRDRGFLYGEHPELPHAIKEECKWRWKYIYSRAEAHNT